jgi:hypothetical protein
MISPLPPFDSPSLYRETAQLWGAQNPIASSACERIMDTPPAWAHLRSQWTLPIALRSRKIWRKPSASFNSRVTRCVSAMAGRLGRRRLRPPFRNSAWRRIPPGSGSRKTDLLRQASPADLFKQSARRARSCRAPSPDGAWSPGRPSDLRPSAARCRSAPTADRSFQWPAPRRDTLAPPADLRSRS